ncbi:MAG: hypothetical protein PUI31_02355 [Clostridia bacterium]|nr:hypothetical protein [Clostridiales bacterium]MDD7165499.1 hypothetical protein [Clostridia bacterium]MDD7165508.1 hypothetical protein [Clostridia bacterium]MDY2900878.1 hypothetical protein [Christensenellaceae bacterium]
MKKTISILSLLCVLTLLFSLCSCSSGFKGKYRLKMIYNIESDKLYEPGDTYQEAKLSEDTITLNVNSDNTLILKTSTKDSSVEKKGIWYKIGDNQYRSFISGDDIYITADGNTVVITAYSEMQVIILKK